MFRKVLLADTKRGRLADRSLIIPRLGRGWGWPEVGAQTTGQTLHHGDEARWAAACC